jgi:hypothetical protein
MFTHSRVALLACSSHDLLLMLFYKTVVEKKDDRSKETHHVDRSQEANNRAEARMVQV